MVNGLIIKLRVVFCLTLARLNYAMGQLLRAESFYPDARDRH